MPGRKAGGSGGCRCPPRHFPTLQWAEEGVSCSCWSPASHFLIIHTLKWKSRWISCFLDTTQTRMHLQTELLLFWKEAWGWPVWGAAIPWLSLCQGWVFPSHHPSGCANCPLCSPAAPRSVLAGPATKPSFLPYLLSCSSVTSLFFHVMWITFSLLQILLPFPTSLSSCKAVSQTLFKLHSTDASVTSVFGMI